MKSKSVLLVIAASNFNDNEFLTIKSVLEKAGLKVFIASDAPGLCVGKNGLKIKADVLLYNANHSNFAAIVIIGGSGIKDYWNNEKLIQTSKNFVASKKLIAAICSAPVIFAKAGLMGEKNATCYPDDKKELTKAGANYFDESTVVDGKIITGRDPNSSQEFAELITEKISSNINQF